MIFTFSLLYFFYFTFSVDLHCPFSFNAEDINFSFWRHFLDISLNFEKHVFLQSNRVSQRYQNRIEISEKAQTNALVKTKLDDVF